ncbi:MAG TPA: IS1 family transposase [Candidatus Acidoferrales bacterium]
MNKLPKQRRAAVIASLVEGNSVRATVRMTGVAKDTVLKLLAAVGQACLEYQDKTLRNLRCKQIQCDEIWSFVGAKEKNASDDKKEQGWGDVWTWVAIDPESKVVPSFMVGDRGAQTARVFMEDLASRLANRVQLTTDGHRVYLNAVENAFGGDVDYAMLVKLYGTDAEAETRYSPAECIGCQTVGITGRPNPAHISTSHVERQNLTMRMKMRRFTRLTNGFSKKIENHLWAIALHYMHYNFCRVHQTLRVTPAMEAGVADHVWSIEEVVDLLDAEAKRAA